MQAMLSLPTQKPPLEMTSLNIIDKVSRLSSQNMALDVLVSLLKNGKPVVLSFINAHAYNLCCENINFTKALMESDLLLRDGVGMRILYKSIGKDPGANLNGTDLIPMLMDRSKGKRIALLGTEIPYITRAADKLESEGHNLVLIESGFFPKEYYLKLVQDAEPEIIILGMGMPKQEKVSIHLKNNIGKACLIVNGGAIIDFWGGKFRRAPMWLRQIRLEWFFRLIQEPRRLFFRYVIGNYIFLRRARSLKKPVH